MIDWEKVAPAIVGAFTTIVSQQLEAEKVGASNKFEADWNGRKQGVRHASGLELTLRITRVARIGVDEVRKVETPGDEGGEPTITEHVCGLREITVEAKVERFKNTDHFWAWQTVSRLESALQRSSIRAILAAGGVKLIDTQDPIPVNVSAQDRLLSAALLSVNFSVSLHDPDGVALTDWIESVAFVLKNTNPDGSARPDVEATVTSSD